MSRRDWLYTISIVATSASAMPAGSGRATAIDGGAIRLNTVDYRLEGVEAPTTRDICAINNKPSPCGRESQAFLQRRIAGTRVRCIAGSVPDRYRCFTSRGDLSREVVRAGHALASTSAAGEPYRADQAAAKAAKRGLWRGDFLDPETLRLPLEGRPEFPPTISEQGQAVPPSGASAR